MTGRARRVLLDDTGAAVVLDLPPRRVVSLVPSLTEALAADAPDVLVGATQWCTHPPGLGAARVRGTKNPDRRAIAALDPGLVVANKEENRELDVRRLRAAGIPVWVTVIESVPQGPASLERLFTLALDRPPPAWLRSAQRLLADRPGRGEAVVDADGLGGLGGVHLGRAGPQQVEGARVDLQAAVRAAGEEDHRRGRSPVAPRRRRAGCRGGGRCRSGSSARRARRRGRARSPCPRSSAPGRRGPAPNRRRRSPSGPMTETARAAKRPRYLPSALTPFGPLVTRNPACDGARRFRAADCGADADPEEVVSRSRPTHRSGPVKFPSDMACAVESGYPLPPDIERAEFR
ncbi:helical backbone metal receptor [Streptomonospora wellingtoniae]|uniref:helical backbone metal receptor n=1 Tax=Streptomonospora wellingtoniae TaxID=3075544 RepID=UPI0037DA0C65